MPLFSKDVPAEEQKRAESVWEMVRTLAYAIGLAMVFRSLLFEPFHIPSASMRPTLLEGDYIFVSKYSYGYSHFSFPFGSYFSLFDGRLAERAPKRGDVLVFRLPRDPQIDYIKRLVGLPGDVIQVIDGRLYINDKQVPRKQGKNIGYNDTGVITWMNTYKETMEDTHKTYTTLDMTGMGEVDYTGKITVPEGHYFMMGDNRDNSIDSRYQSEVGFVPKENLIGRAEMILFSIDPASSFEFWEFWKYPSMFRDGRFAKDII